MSTERQAQNDEGSLKNQLQRLRQHLDCRRDVVGERWCEAAVYELRAISGKDLVRSEAFQRLYANIEAGRVNTVLCTALDRICRSVKDFLGFFEFLSEREVEFVSLKENYDTTSPQGKLFVTIMMARAEFEREQTADRTREAALARAERGLWNGGRIVGYDLHLERKGHLVPNEAEVALVNFAFRTYLDCGSFQETADRLNRAGFRTKAYASRRGKEHQAREFRLTTVQHLLKNAAYIGKKVLPSSDGGGRVVDAVWPAIVDEPLYQEVQALMAANGRSGHSGAKFVRHSYVLSNGLLVCGRCGSHMTGRSGTGRQKTKYFYYVCTRDGCAFKVAAQEVEAAVFERIAVLADDPSFVERLVERTNAKLVHDRPRLLKERASAEKQLAEVKAQADRLLERWAGGNLGRSAAFMEEKLEALATRRTDLEDRLVAIDQQMADAESAAMTAEAVCAGLREFNRAYEHLKPYERKELMSLLIHRIELRNTEMVLEFYAGACTQAAAQAQENPDAGVRVRGLPIWLPGSVAQSVLRDVFSIRLSSLERHVAAERQERSRGTEPLAERWQRMLGEGEVANRAELARREGVSRGRVTQVLRGLR